MHRFVRIGTMLQSFYGNFLGLANPHGPLGDQLRARFVAELRLVQQDCDEMGPCKTNALLSWLIVAYQTTEHNQEQLKTAIEGINAAFQRELDENIFIQVNPDRKDWMKTEESFVASPTFGDAVAKNFGSAMRDVREAGNCFAAYRHTACVFYCMRVAEIGLRALAAVLQIPFTIPFEYQQWQNIIDVIELSIRGLEKQLPAGPVKAETLKVYSQAATQFFYFKNAWRNHVAHAREVALILYPGTLLPLFAT